MDLTNFILIVNLKFYKMKNLDRLSLLTLNPDIFCSVCTSSKDHILYMIAVFLWYFQQIVKKKFYWLFY